MHWVKLTLKAPRRRKCQNSRVIKDVNDGLRKSFVQKLATPAILIIYMSYNPPKMEVHLLLAQCFLLPAKQYKEKSLVAATLHELHLPCFFRLHAPPTCTCMHQRHGLSFNILFQNFTKNGGNCNANVEWYFKKAMTNESWSS